jgi:signal transduction histidine kinase
LRYKTVEATVNRKIEEQILDAKQRLGCSHEGQVVVDMDGVVLETTPGADRILESLSLKGRQIRELCAIPGSYDDFVKSADGDSRVMNRPFILLAANGKRKIVNMSMQRVGEGEGARYVFVFQDCADLRTMEERLLQSERLATIGRFASQIAHEIRNPLSSISLNVELLEDELVGSGEEARELIRSVLKELDRLNDIVSEYLQFSRFPKPHLKRGHIDGVVQELIRNFNPPANVRLEMELTPSSPEVWLDESLLRQVLENLVRNGVEAIQGPGLVRIETEVIDKFLVIRVKDNGSGIPADAQARMFQPFFTTKPHGTGLGLATSQQIVFEHNGHLGVDSQPGAGSTFTILLPL